MANKLTRREIETVQLAAEGYSNQRIAICLSVTRKTVELHLAHVVEKLGIFPKDPEINTRCRMIKLYRELVGECKCGKKEDK